MTDQDDRSSIARGSARDPARDALREALIDARRRLSPQRRRTANDALVERLRALLGDVAGESIAIYWPVRGEPSLDALPELWSRAGARLALPVVDGRDRPLRFVAWAPGEPTVAGPFGVPRPAADDALRPSVLVVPCVGFDARCYRLGYGGGYYDRSLAAMDADGRPPPRAIGVAFDEGRLDAFEPLPTDRALDAVVTPSALLRRAAVPPR